MKRFAMLFALLAFVGLSLQAQRVQITGTVTSADDGLSVPGASIVVRGTTIGTITDFDGKYTLDIPGNSTHLIFSFVGLKTQEIAIDGRETIDVVLESDVFGLDEVVVSGVASGTPRKKLSVTVGVVSEEQLKEVPATSAATALQGKLAGVKVIQASGTPGSAASIRLRGATKLTGSQAPLIILDGVLMEGTLADINVDDIASMEVVKGAAASALYGSRAGNGVIVISTKRGKNLAAGETVVTVRNEYGQSSLAKQFPVSKHHYYSLQADAASENRYTKFEGAVIYGDNPGEDNPDSLGILLSGSRLTDSDHYMDNEFGVVYDHQDMFYQPGDFYTNYVSVAHNGTKTNFLASFENSKQQGIIFGASGYDRQNFRFNVDHRFSDKFSFSTSNLIISSNRDYSALDFFSLMQLQPDYNLNQKNADGTDYFLLVDQFGTTDNPLYQVKNDIDDGKGRRILSSYKVAYQPISWMKLDVQYAFENELNNRTNYQAYGYLTRSSYPDGQQGYLFKNFGKTFAQTFQTTMNLQEQFGDFTVKGKLSYLFENNKWEGFSTSGRNFAVRNVPDMSLLDQDEASNSSYTGEIVAENIFGIVDFDYKAKYIGSFLYRYDGASQFGSEERWNPYFRASAAYRISEDVTIPGVSELKIRAAYGTSGIRPPWNAQYETWNASGGSVTKSQLGNNFIKPSQIAETEVALNVEFLNRFDLEVAYSITDAKDVHYNVPLPASAGYLFQWQNMGTLNSKSIEATLGIRVFETSDFSWSANLTFDRIRTKVTELNVPAFTMGARGNSGNPGAFFIEEGAIFGEFTGEKVLRSMDDMVAQLALLGDDGERYYERTIDEFTLNADGYVIESGTEGTVNEIPVKLYGEDGNPANIVIGNANPDFNMGISNTFTFKGFSLYALLDWKQGGDIYNLTNQWMYRDDRSADEDMFGVTPNEKKTYDYYISLYNVANKSSHFIENGTYVKLREVSLYYSLGRSQMSGLLNGFFKGLRVGVVGRNLLTWTNYSGFDPEVSTGEGGVDPSMQAWDEFSYPNFRTITGTIEFKF